MIGRHLYDKRTGLWGLSIIDFFTKCAKRKPSETSPTEFTTPLTLESLVRITREDLAYRVFFVFTRTITRDLNILREVNPDVMILSFSKYFYTKSAI
jgi:hypothetical protein